MSWDFPFESSSPSTFAYPPPAPVSDPVRKVIIRRTLQQRAAPTEAGSEAGDGEYGAPPSRTAVDKQVVSSTEILGVANAGQEVIPPTPQLKEKSGFDTSIHDNVEAVPPLSDGGIKNDDQATQVSVKASNVDLRTLAMRGVLSEEDVHRKLEELKAEKHEIFNRLRKLQQERSHGGT
ncbi:uncharacterized protein SPPG_01351 [Spizellomyces punctatus DAOM BR117]|uniref:Uncharacterized protein n=1 Tax=Spizellomyces punctatus (strain DAOM BR117) TaxID=645134 RepID=A0A0L0HS34_SPIPD|nr:uncharacterized protein SPPG_01351 [Spizellomyces punctatus DAOM BR117]KND03897.1 hypothetical protein SPPG_01351 [Spizellomyces punctatus DAOM BR117]|eukprot:XP_016611936.1 hypothetical protein SPPG_01351 [Spizellomyces punctatus DAOM BR117]